MAQPEKSFENKLKRWLESQGIYPLGTPKQDMPVPPCGYWEKRWGGGKFVKSGMPDMHIVVKCISLEVELKAPNGKLSDIQKQKLDQIADSQCMSMVLYPDDFPKFQKLIQVIKTNAVSQAEMVTYAGLGRR